jgi:hypothetical protein
LKFWKAKAIKLQGIKRLIGSLCYHHASESSLNTNLWLESLAIDSTTIDNAKAKYELLRDPKTLLGLACVLPLLEAMQALSKFAQTQTIFICDFIFQVKVCQFDL